MPDSSTLPAPGNWPEIAVFVPAYNAAPWIERMIRSVLRQTWHDFVLIILDDGSTDDTVARIRPHLQDSRIQLLSDSTNRGLVARLNQSVALCQSPFYARMDAEDLMHPERLARQRECLISHPDAAFCATSACLIDTEDQILGVRRAVPPTPKTALTQGALIHPTLLAHTRFLRENSYSSEFPRAEDRELFIRNANWTRGLYLDEPLLFYRYLTNAKTAAILTGYRSERKIIAQSGPKLIGLLPSVMAYGLSLAKSAYVRLRGIQASGLTRNLDRRSEIIQTNRKALESALQFANSGALSAALPNMKPSHPGCNPARPFARNP